MSKVNFEEKERLKKENNELKMKIKSMEICISTESNHSNHLKSALDEAIKQLEEYEKEGKSPSDIIDKLRHLESAVIELDLLYNVLNILKYIFIII